MEEIVSRVVLTGQGQRLSISTVHSHVTRMKYFTNFLRFYCHAGYYICGNTKEQRDFCLHMKFIATKSFY